MADVGTGTSITFSTGFFAEVLNTSLSGLSRESVDTTHMSTATAKTFMPSDLYDPGELSVDLAFDPSTAAPITGAAETVTIAFPDGSTWAASGFLTSFELTAQLEEKMTASATIKLSGAITVT